AVTVMERLNRTAAERMVEAGARACTDITGFGLLGHALEMAEASRVEIAIDHRRVPHFPEALVLLEEGLAFGGLAANRTAFGDKVRFNNAVPGAWRNLLLDPQTSGGLLVALPTADAESLVKALRAGGDTDAALVGRVEQPAAGVRIHVE
ncbi:MAG: selenide, water dikinase SelD, partial [Gammaproteobacteria bacterium]|nr:selenide, water dikinase SelD [Gammaproteobacteria bacterium]NIR99018.1 selenide, water dikinase SelD [Gammaproteobacteria bacterium]NIT64644.1 selenide, water dikinase SelD [Gammaproteobacteria bacterium]NIV21617.1 selenide, water dikinase SelD [Gammaproteobacteria bacterium]NIY33224.1 selenide, water dikinase SelD [Gammaproteobacteria bacterium]